MRKVNVDKISWEKLYNRSADHKQCNILWLVNFKERKKKNKRADAICLPEKPSCTSSECYISLKVVHVREFNFHKLRRLLRPPLKSTSTLLEVYLKVVVYGCFYNNFFELYFRGDSNITVHDDRWFLNLWKKSFADVLQNRFS